MAGPYVIQTLYSYAQLPSTTWRTDIILDTPELLAPPDGENVCPDNSEKVDGPEDFGEELTWRTVSGATFYIVQICNNSSFHGPTLRSIKRSATGGDTQTFIPEADVDVRFAETIHWRVMAYNTTGGVSQKSDAWSFKNDCESDDGDGGNKGKSSPPKPGSGGGGGPGGAGGNNKAKCEKFKEKVKIDGPAQTMCDDAVMYHLQAAFACKDADGNDLIAIEDAIWQVFSDPDGVAAGVPCVKIRQQNKNMVVLDIKSCKESQTFMLRVNVIFVNAIDATKMNCVAEKRVFVDCDTGKPEYKPWLTGNYINDPYTDSVIYTHPDYHGPSIAVEPDDTLPKSKTEVVEPLASTESPGLMLDEKKKGIGVGPVIRFGIKDLGKADSGSTQFGKKGVPFPGRVAGELKEARIHIPLGCGLSIDTTVDPGQKKIGIDVDEIIGAAGSRVGLEPNAENDNEPKTCLIEVAVGCGIAIYDEAVVVNEIDLAGQGLEAASDNELTDCRLDVKLGDCLQFDSNDAIELDKTCIPSYIIIYGGQYGVGCGLFIQDNKLKIDADDLVGPGLATDGECGLQVVPGCGIKIDENDKVAIERAEIAGLGLKVGSGECNIDVDYGCGLKLEGNTLKIDNTDLAGPGLEVYGDCGLKVTPTVGGLDYGCGLTVESGTLKIDNTDLAGPGLETYGDCGLKVTGGTSSYDFGCGLRVTGNTVKVEAGDLAEGPGISTYGTDCGLQVGIGCGLEFDVGGDVAVDVESLAGPGLEITGDAGCQFGIDAGCGLEIYNDQIRVNNGNVGGLTPGIAGPGLLPYGECAVQLDLGCGLKFSGAFFGVEVDPEDLAGEGLGPVTGPGNCGLYVDVAPCGGLDIDENEQLEVDHVKTDVYTFHTIKNDDSAIALTLEGCELKLTLTLVEQKIGSNCGGVHFGSIPTGAESMISGTITLPTSELEVMTGIEGLNCYCTPITETVKHINC